MNWDAIGAVGQVLGSAAVFVTLFYMTLQVRESRKSNRSVAHATWAAGQGALLGQVSTNRDLSDLLLNGCFAPQELDDKTWHPFMTWLQQLLYNTTAIHQMNADGVVSDDMLELELNKAIAVLRTPGASQWWRAGGRTHVSAELAAVLDDRLEKSNRWSTIVWSAERGFHAAPGQRGDSIPAPGQ
jgi:hypothetical protein